MDINFDALNTGYKLHIPAVEDPNDPLTRKIIEFLDQKFNITPQLKYDRNHNIVPQDSKQYNTPCYKLGYSDGIKCGETFSVYGRTGTIEEMQSLAKELEAKFGKELAQCIKDNDVKFPKESKRISDNIVTRFAVYRYGYWENDALQEIFTQRSSLPNPSGATIKYLTYDSVGKPCNYLRSHGGYIDMSRLSDIDKKFLFGDCTMANIDHFGELFTGHIKDGKVPQFIMDGLPKEYLQKYNLSEADILTRIQKGNVNLTSLMLRDIARNGADSNLLRQGARPIFTNFPFETINEAKELLAQYDNEAVKQLEKQLPQLKISHPVLGILEKTTPLNAIKVTQIDDLLPSFKMLNRQVDGTLDLRNKVTQVTPQAKPVVQKQTSWVDDVVAKWKATINPNNPTSNSVAIKKTSACPQVLGLNKPTGYTQTALVDIDKVFSTLTRGEPQARVIKPTTPVLEDVISAALQKVHKTPVVNATAPRSQNISKIICTALKHIKI